VKYNILVVDDEKNIREGLAKLLEMEGHRSIPAADGQEALAVLEQGEVDLVVTDLKMPNLPGEELLRRAQSVAPGLPVIILTGHGTIESAVQAMKEGAADYILKPIKMDEMEILIEKTLAVSRLEDENREMKLELKSIYGAENIIGAHPLMAGVVDLIRQVADTKTTVLIQGESGTGKELVARAIHVGSGRASGPFVVINCAAIPGTLLESELFGHEKGAFTGALKTKKGRLEVADRGTLFLDEIGEMPRELQVKILRMMEEQKFQRVGGTEDIEVDNRILAATNRDLKKAVEAGSFREDLYYRLKVITISIPPLRERKEDIPILAEHFLRKHRANLRKKASRLTGEALQMLTNHDWPGNVRELENALVRAIVLCPGEVIEPRDLPEEIRGRAEEKRTETPGSPADREKLKQMKKEIQQKVKAEVERKFVVEALRSGKGNVQRSAARVGMDRRQFQNLIKKYGISKEDFVD
jgi:DNA-binding NtrC family response regulator